MKKLVLASLALWSVVAFGQTPSGGSHSSLSVAGGGVMKGTFAGGPTFDNGGVDLTVGTQIKLGSAVPPGGDAYVSSANGQNINLLPIGGGIVKVSSKLAVMGQVLIGRFDPISGGNVTPALYSSISLPSGILSTTGYANYIQINSDNIAAPSQAIIYLQESAGLGPSFSGTRTGLVTALVQGADINIGPGGIAPIVAMMPSVTLNRTFGGTGTTPSTAAGGGTAINPYFHLASGATNSGGGSTAEFDWEADAGSSYVDGLGLLLVRTADDAVQGTRDNIAISIGNAYTQATGKGWICGFCLGNSQGWFPLDPTGTIMGAQTPSGTMTVAHGIDWSRITFTSDSLKLPGFTVNGNGTPTLRQTTPASSSAPCTAGQIAVDVNYFYECVATNTWKRAALSSF